MADNDAVLAIVDEMIEQARKGIYRDSVTCNRLMAVRLGLPANSSEVDLYEALHPEDADLTAAIRSLGRTDG